ncbi:unnamed protein product [Effrenium voratum]|uniref:NADPH--hemoprotein reductase n=1 Tax=Effrenium voratum TaxID=2562239 RepID=A0AA36MXI8_9DINO|nr:unnamed protein product [Effrenium voratum]CAJ1435388.1 unnamed protein product [Effrenium voratum]
MEGAALATKCHVYFGTQTGKAEGFAHDLCREANSQGFPCEVFDLANFSPGKFITCNVAILILANTGDGEPTDNATGFYNWLRSCRKEDHAFAQLFYTVFGLGDRQYVHFNRVGRFVDERLELLGAQRIYQQGTGDDGGTIQQDFTEWIHGGLWPALDPILARTGDDSPELPLPVLEAQASFEKRNAPYSPKDVLSRAYFDSYEVRVLRVGELRQVQSVADGESTVHVELDAGADSHLDYHAAGTLEVLPQNDMQDVEQILPLLWIPQQSRTAVLADLDSMLDLPGAHRGSGAKVAFPLPCSLKDALVKYCDLNTAPTRQMLHALKPHFKPDVQFRIEKLLNDCWAMSVIQDRALAWTQFEFWTSLEATPLPLGAFLQYCPRQRARPYTIASSPLQSAGIQIAVSLTSWPKLHLDDFIEALRARGIILTATNSGLQRKGRRYGLCSFWMCTRLRKGDLVAVRVRPSSFRLTSRDVPVIMIAAGAGVAPFRAFWSELRYREAPAILLFGCKHPDRDWIYQKEMQTARRHNILAELITAFSRQDAAGAFVPTVQCGSYVQRRLREMHSRVREWVSAGGIVYMCGSTAMGKAVLEALTEIFGDERILQLRQEGRIVQELWGDTLHVSVPLKPPAKRKCVEDVIRKRRSIFPKDYTGEAVADSQVHQLLEAARWAPTHGKTEPWRFVVFAAEGRLRLIEATLSFYSSQSPSFWAQAWNGEFKGFPEFKAHVDKQRSAKWLKCSHLISICMRRQQYQEGKRLFPEHEEIAAVSCAVQNMHLEATSLGVAAYWSSWFEHFTASSDGIHFHGLNAQEGDKWLGVFCIGHSDIAHRYRASRRSVDDFTQWRST